MEKKDFIKILEDLQNHLHDRTARPEDVLVELRDTLEDYSLRNENLKLRENYKTSDELQEMMMDALKQSINRLYYFIGDANIYDVSVMYVDNYWNCEWKVTYDDLWNVIENILDSLDK